jgi:hypothetical protein
LLDQGGLGGLNSHAYLCLLLPPPADIVLNVESEHKGGMRTILKHILEFFKEHPGGCWYLVPGGLRELLRRVQSQPAVTYWWSQLLPLPRRV